MQLDFGHQHFVMHPAGLLYWPAQGFAIVSDLHLEKGSHLARRGFFVPPYDTHATLTRLLGVLAHMQPQRLLVLGDTFHDAQGFARMNGADMALFETLGRYKPLWVRGNHDGEYVPAGFEGCDTYRAGDIVFRHEATQAPDLEISGHYHPKADIRYKGALVSRRCFIEDGRKIIMPAFGAYTGGLSIRDPAIMRFFTQGYRLHLLGEERIYSLGALPSGG